GHAARALRFPARARHQRRSRRGWGPAASEEMSAVAASLAVLFTLMFEAAAFAQPGATLRVTVVDPSNAVIVGAHVTVTSPAGASTTLDSGTRGDASFTGLEAGRYSIHVESAGFESADVRDLRVRAGETSRM